MNIKTLPNKPGRKMSVEEINCLIKFCEPSIILNIIRDKRNYLLKRCDWVLLEGSSVTDDKKQEWIEHRQALRNLPQQYINNGVVDWPLSPQ
jgi:hypothetical protein